MSINRVVPDSLLGIRNPVYFSTVILKLTSFCNLDCSYCYMFSLADQTHLRIQNYMSPYTAIRGISALASHVLAHNGDRIQIVLHGGEPSLWPIAHFRALAKHISAVRKSGVAVNLTIQTNGVAIRRDLIDLLIEIDASLGVSLDGPVEVNDRRRVNHAGLGSYHRVIDNLQAILAWGFDPRKLGILSVVSPEVMPREYFE